MLIVIVELETLHVLIKQRATLVLPLATALKHLDWIPDYSTEELLYAELKVVHLS